MTSDTDSFDTDFLIVGSGFGGSVSALRLAEKGYDVVVLEQGRRYRTKDFPRTNWSLRKYVWAPRLGLQGIQVLTFLRHALVLHGRGVGGGSLVYANILIEPRPEVFEGEEWGQAEWHSRLQPYFVEARRMLGATPCVGVGGTDELLREIADELGVGASFHVHDVGVFFGDPGETVPDPYFGGDGPERTGCTKCAACMVGCSVGAKNTLDKNYLWFAERLGVRIVSETEAFGIRPIEGGYAVETKRSLGWRRPRRSWRARQVVVSGGVIGSVRLLQESRARGWLPDISPRLGDFVRTNSESLLAADSRDRAADWSDHVAITSGIQADADTHVEMVRFNRGSDALFWLTIPMVQGFHGLPRPLRALLSTLRHPLRFVRSLWPFGRGQRAGIVLAMQTTEGHLTLGLARKWWRLGRRDLSSRLPEGQPRPVLDIPVAEDIARRLAKKMGGHPSMTLPVAILGAPTTAHVLGGCRIARGPEDGVVDGEGRVFGYRGLYVVDGSVVPSNLGVNPSLTITAIAEYMMSKVPE